MTTRKRRFTCLTQNVFIISESSSSLLLSSFVQTSIIDHQSDCRPGGDGLAALELEPGAEDVPPYAAEEPDALVRRVAQRGLGRKPAPRHEKPAGGQGKEPREQALAEVEHEHGRAAPHAPSAHRGCGGAVYRPLLADVLVEEYRGDDEPPRDGSQKEADDEQANRD